MSNLPSPTGTSSVTLVGHPATRSEAKRAAQPQTGKPASAETGRDGSAGRVCGSHVHPRSAKRRDRCQVGRSEQAVTNRVQTYGGADVVSRGARSTRKLIDGDCITYRRLLGIADAGKARSACRSPPGRWSHRAFAGLGGGGVAGATVKHQPVEIERTMSDARASGNGAGTAAGPAAPPSGLEADECAWLLNQPGALPGPACRGR
jgi:hypothetical protein